MAQVPSWTKTIYFPLQGEQGVSRFLLKYSNDSLVGPSTEDALHEEKVPYTPPLAYFKLKDFPRDPIPSLGQRLSDALPDILENRIELDDCVSHMWPNGCDQSDSVKMDILIMPEEVVTSLMFRASLPADLRSRHPGFVARQTLAKTMGTLPRPSASGSDPKQLFEHAGTLAGRPFGRCGPPASIFDSHLAGLADALRDLALAVPVPSSSKVAWALKFFIAALGFYNDEAEIVENVRPLLVELFDYSEWHESIEGGRDLTHGAGWIYELKTQKGLGGDPEAQSIADYEKLLADKMTMVARCFIFPLTF
ncbi:hypothetical protein B0H13DRAFT_1966242 [Mycena leptocephala]|nr:hypothetical protein B0H13DRAFT_1966242 [Mycena leptocephala]